MKPETLIKKCLHKIEIQATGIPVYEPCIKCQGFDKSCDCYESNDIKQNPKGKYAFVLEEYRKVRNYLLR